MEDADSSEESSSETEKLFHCLIILEEKTWFSVGISLESITEAWNLRGSKSIRMRIPGFLADKISNFRDVFVFLEFKDAVHYPEDPEEKVREQDYRSRN